MKITIEPDGKEDFEKRIFENVFEFALIGRNIIQGISEETFSHLHVADKYVLTGKLEELKERLHGSSD